MNRQANVQSIDALNQFRRALAEYAEAIEDVLGTLSVESQRTVDWVQVDRAAYWPAQVEAASVELAEARTALQMKQTTIDNRDRPPATAERKRVQLAKQRLSYAEAKVRRTRQLSGQVQHLADEYRGLLGKLSQLTESQIPQAMASLARMAASLERYAQLRSSGTNVSPGGPRVASSQPSAAATESSDSREAGS